MKVAWPGERSCNHCHIAATSRYPVVRIQRHGNSAANQLGRQRRQLIGRRMPIKATRALVTGALDGSLKGVSFRTDPYFGVAVPTSVPGVEPHLL